MCYHVKFGSAATKGVPINRRETQHWAVLGPRPVAVGRGSSLNKPTPHMCYHVKFGSSASKGMRIEGNPQNWVALWPAPLRQGRG